MSSPADSSADAAHAAGPPAAAVEVTRETRCKRDEDCHLFVGDCGSYCGSCPESGTAVNRIGLRELERACARERRQWDKEHRGRRRKHVACGACRGGYASASCADGACVKTISNPKTSIDDLFKGQ